ncbi:MAG: LutC/YkgG family protein [Chitinophagales bacterium]
MDSRKQILQNIRLALEQKNIRPYTDINISETAYTDTGEALEILFAKNLNEAKGKFVYCEDERNFLELLLELIAEKQWRHLYCWDEDLQNLLKAADFNKCRLGSNLDRADAGLTFCEALIAERGSVVVSSALSAGRALSIFPNVHIVLGYFSQLVFNITESFELLRLKYGNNLPSMISLITGPSRTADIEKTLVMGAHGPKELYVFLIDDTDIF